MSVGGDRFEVEEVEIRVVRLKVLAQAPSSRRSDRDGSVSHDDEPYLIDRDERPSIARAHTAVVALPRYAAGKVLGRRLRETLAAPPTDTLPT
jgi:hypothetical protein